jgi:hypothetical protein
VGGGGVGGQDLRDFSSTEDVEHHLALDDPYLLACVFIIRIYLKYGA